MLSALASGLCEDVRGRRLPLFALLLLVIVALVVWKFAAPGEQFLPAFARLLTAPSVQRGAFSFFSGRSYATGTFYERDVAIRLQLKRSRYGQGYFVVAVRTNGLPLLDYTGLKGAPGTTVDDARCHRSRPTTWC